MEWTEISSATSGRQHANIKHFIETGTYQASTAIMASKHYENVHTVEIYKPLYEQALEKTRDINNIHCYLGDSIEQLPNMMKHIPANDGVVVFLDAHISGNDSGWNGKDRVPLLKELDIILNYKLGPSLFIIDDIRFFKDHESEAWDWKHLDNMRLIRLIISKGYEVLTFFESNDRLWIFTN